MRHVLIALAGLTLAACGPITPDSATGDFVSTQHGAAQFEGAVSGAKAYCAARGKDAKHVGTDRIAAFQSVSRFECVPK